MLEVETDVLLDLNDASDFVKNIMAPRRKIVEAVPVETVKTVDASEASKPEPMSMERFFVERLSPDKFAEGVVNLTIEEGHLLVPREKVSAGLMAESTIAATSTEKPAKAKMDPSDVVKKLTEKLSAKGGAPKNVRSVIPDDLNSSALKLSRLAVSSHSDDIIDELYKINPSRYPDKVKRLNALAFESIYDACTNDTTFSVLKNNTSTAEKSMFNGSLVSASIECSFSERPSWFKAPHLKHISRLLCKLGLEKNNGRLKVTFKNKTVDRREEWAVAAGAAIANKFLETTLTEESAFEDSLYLQAQRMVHAYPSVRTIRTRPQEPAEPIESVDIEGMKYILAAATASVEAISLEGMPVIASKSIESSLKDAGIPTDNGEVDRAKFAIEHWMFRSTTIGYYGDDLKMCTLTSIVPNSPESLAIAGLNQDMIKLGASLGIDVSVYIAALGLADIILGYIASVANLVCELAAPKVFAAYYVKNSAGNDNLDVVYSLGNYSPHIVAKNVKYKRNMYVAAPLYPIVGDAASKIYGYNVHEPLRAANSMALALDSVLSIMRSNMLSVASMLKEPRAGYFNSKLGITKDKPILMLFNNTVELTWSNHTRNLTSKDRIKLEGMFEGVIDALCSKMYVITNRRPLIPEEVRYANHDVTVYKESGSYTYDLTHNEYMFVPAEGAVMTDIPDEMKEYIIELSKAMGAKRGRIGSKLDDSVLSYMPPSWYHGTRGMIDPALCNEVLGAGRIVYGMAAGHLTRPADTVHGHYIEGQLIRGNSSPHRPISAVSESSERKGNIIRRIHDILGIKDVLVAKYPEYKLSAVLPTDRGYVTDRAPMLTVSDIRQCISDNLSIEISNASLEKTSWTDAEKLKKIRSSRGANARKPKPLALCIESPDLTKVMYIRNGLLLKDKDLIKYRILNAIAFMLPLSEFRAPTDEEVSDAADVEIDNYVPAELSSILRKNKARLLKEAMEARKSKLRTLREQYAKEYRESVPILRISSRELREVSSGGAVLPDEQKISRLIAAGEILGARVSAQDITVLLPQVNIWAHASVYNIGKIVLVLSGFGTNNAQAFFYCLNHLETRYPMDVAKSICASEDRTIDAPHVRNGVACYGNIAPALRDAMSKGDLTSTVLLCKSYVNSVNLNDGYGNNIYKWPSVPATMYNLIKFGVLHAGHPTQSSLIVFNDTSVIRLEHMTWDLYAAAYEIWKLKLEQEGYYSHPWTDKELENLAAANNMNTETSLISYTYGKDIVPEVPAVLQERSAELLKKILMDPKSIADNHSKKECNSIWSGADIESLVPNGFSEDDMQSILAALEVLESKRQSMRTTSTTKTSYWSSWAYPSTGTWSAVYSSPTT